MVETQTFVEKWKDELFPENRHILVPLESVTSVTEIDFAKYAEAGIVNWGFDIEGTIAKFGSKTPIIRPPILNHIREAKRGGHIQRLFLVTNRRSKSPSEGGFAGLAGQIVGADLVLSKSDELAGKPKPDMILRAMDELGIKPEHTAYVGDKLTADIRSANEANLAASIFVSPREGADSEDKALDMLIRRPLEFYHGANDGIEVRGSGPLGMAVNGLIRVVVRLRDHLENQ